MQPVPRSVCFGWPWQSRAPILAAPGPEPGKSSPGARRTRANPTSPSTAARQSFLGARAPGEGSPLLRLVALSGLSPRRDQREASALGDACVSARAFALETGSRATGKPLYGTPALSPCMEVGEESEAARTLSSRFSAHRRDPAGASSQSLEEMAAGETPSVGGSRQGGPANQNTHSQQASCVGSSRHLAWEAGGRSGLRKFQEWNISPMLLGRGV
jgi:hypothetical protein